VSEHAAAMSELSLDTLRSTVLWSTFLVTFAMGAIMSRANYDAMGAIADVVNERDWTRMRVWLCAIGVAMVGTQLLALTDIIDLEKSRYLGPRFTWLSHLVGGLLFGFGMVLASGCAARSLVKIGGGSLKSLVVFLAMGVFAWLTLSGPLALLKNDLLDRVAIVFAEAQDLSHVFAGTAADKAPEVRLAMGGGLGMALVVFAFMDRRFRRFDQVLAGVGVGLAVVGTWYISGRLGHVDLDPITLEERFVGTYSGRLESLSFVAPAAHLLQWLTHLADRNEHLSLGIAAVLGTVTGSFAHSLAMRRLRLETFEDRGDLARHLVGAAMMGVGGAIALGCTVGQGLSGLSTLSSGSILTFCAIVAGAVAGIRFRGRRSGEI